MPRELLRLEADAPVGTKVVVSKDDHSIVETVTRSEPWKTAGGWLVKVEGISGGYLLSRVSRIEP